VINALHLTDECVHDDIVFSYTVSVLLFDRTVDE